MYCECDSFYRRYGSAFGAIGLSVRIANHAGGAIWPIYQGDVYELDKPA